MRNGRWLLASVLFVSLWVEGSARAEDDLLRLTWTAPLGCPTTAEVRAAVMRNVDPHAALPGVLEADARVEEGEKGWRVLLTTKRGAMTGERTIEAPTCTGVADATAVVLALALAPPGTAPAEPSPPSPPPPPPKPEPATKPPRHHTTAFGVSGLVDIGALPKAALGGGAHVAFTPGRWRVELAGRLLAEQTKHVEGTPAGATFSLFGAGGRFCGAIVRSTSVDLSPCVGAGLEVMKASGLGADTNFEPTKAWMRLDAGALARFKLTHWFALRLSVEADLPLYRPNFVVQNVGTVYQPSSVGVSAGFGAEILAF